ncbi:hypothetical protein A2924_00415 [Candidatus Giovannonibacteria bacterium RIFCSPLOWO2_01_FULL_44_16]|uniref:Uncharacterized protein n=1 Tax=Candidatus Giovannonibacteria bacterium RIFCSPLOWO2_01_FULL_44_16 TaxID=1798348 RepID=A0A1F5X2K8_9BACT|nr:MAG: hypothetical protein A2924_00415 [Candidatus Giovannonibacteria bacterium RIFCSPLOWO2_01_FULL_44_16]
MRKIRHVLSAEDFDHSSLIDVFAETDKMKAACEDPQLAPALAHILIKDEKPLKFYILTDPSTRTETSFENAIENLGGKCKTKPLIFSSISKGETHRSTARTLGPYCICIIIRDDKDEFAAQAMAQAVKDYGLDVVIINAGCGKKEHPTQMLIDLYTIYERRRDEFVSGKLTYAFVGDISHSRTIHSDLLGLRNFGGTAYLAGPESENLPPWLTEKLKNSRLTLHKITDTLKIADKVDFWYFTRLQQNLRQKKVSKYANQRYAELFGANEQLRKKMRKDAVVLHPLPHGPEYHEKIDLEDPRFVHFLQADNGLYVRMALLKMIFDPHTEIKKLALERGFVEVSGFFRTIDIAAKDIINICRKAGCRMVEVQKNGWISMSSMKKKEEFANLLPNTFCKDCRNNK